MSAPREIVAGPERTPPVEDVGADTQRRFRYQACYTATISLGLLDDEGPIERLYCEHHDDILLILRTGSSFAIQLKTRLEGRVPFKAGDEEILVSLRRFATLELLFPGHFEGYRIASNVGFWHEKKNGSNLAHILERCKSGGEAGPLKKRILAKHPEISPEPLSAALQKVELVETPGLPDVEARLREALATIPEFRDRRYDELEEASKTLVQRVQEAGSLADAGAVPEYLVLCSGAAASLKAQHTIDTKRITKEVIIRALTHGFSASPMLRTHQAVSLDELPKGMKKMVIKMAAGGLSVATIDHFKDLKSSAEILLQQWLYKYGSERAQQDYEHLRVLVRDECIAAQLNCLASTTPYGNAMHAKLREQLTAVVASQRVELRECSPQHLLGMAGILTEDCKVWWSAEFHIPEESDEPL
jgi:hypothetical protein